MKPGTWYRFPPPPPGFVPLSISSSAGGSCEGLRALDSSLTSSLYSVSTVYTLSSFVLFVVLVCAVSRVCVGRARRPDGRDQRHRGSPPLGGSPDFSLSTPPRAPRVYCVMKTKQNYNDGLASMLTTSLSTTYGAALCRTSCPLHSNCDRCAPTAMPSTAAMRVIPEGRRATTAHAHRQAAVPRPPSSPRAS